MQRPIQRLKFTKAIARHTKIRDQNPSLGNICPGEPHERSPNAPKFEDRSQEETECQEQGAREAAWKLAENVFKLKEHERATFFSPSENRWMIEFLNTETLTPVLLMKHLLSPHSRDVRIWVSTVFILISLKTGIARSVKGPKLQGHHAEDAIVELYLVLKILVT